MNSRPLTPTGEAAGPPLRHPAAGQTTLYLVRHGRTASNVRQVLCGSTDEPLDAHGLQQAHRVAERLMGEPAIDAVLTSPLARAVTTAGIIGERIGREPVVVPGLVEMDFGDLEGKAIVRLVEEHPRIVARMLDLGEDAAWPGGESRRDFHARVLATFEAILTEHAAHRVVVVAHGGVIASFLAQMHGHSPLDWQAFQVDNCGLTHLDVMPDRSHVHLFNDVVHLELLGSSDEDEEVSG